MLDGRVDVDDEVDVVDVHAARRDVGRHEHAHSAVFGSGGEGAEVALARILRQVAVQVDGGDPRGGELLRELLRLVLGAGEEDAATGARGELAHECGLVVGGVDDQHTVRHLADGHALLVDLVADRVREEAAGEGVDAAVQGRAEQQTLSTGRGRGEDAGDAGQEAEVGHVIGLIEHGDLDRAQANHLLLHEVFESTGAGHDDVDAAAQRLLLRTLADAAEDGRDAQARGLGERCDGRGDLRRELTRGGEDESAREAGTALSAGSGEARDERQGEGDGLAAARASATQEVASGEGVGKGVALDGERLGLAGIGENGGELGGNAEFKEVDMQKLRQRPNEGREIKG